MIDARSRKPTGWIVRLAVGLTIVLWGCGHGRAGSSGSGSLPPMQGPSSEGIYEATLPNGLEVLMKEVHAAPIMCVSIWYRAGSKHEEVGRTGLAHLLEHMMFKGTEQYGKGVYDRMLEGNGALNNATTWLDRTNYYVMIAADRMDVAMKLEADRMRGALFTDQDLEDEMPVVRNEMEIGEDDPVTELDERIGSSAFLEHPYHWPTIGWKSDVEAIRATDIHAYYDRYYWPNNAYLVLVGDLPASEMLAKAVEHFGSLPAGGVEPRVVTVEPPQKGERRFLIRESGETRLLGFGYRVPEATHPDMPAIATLGLILAQGRSSRLYRAMVERGLASDVQAYAQPMEEPFLFFVYLTLAENADPDQVEQMLDEEIARLQQEAPSDAEIARAIKQYKVSTLFERDDLTRLMFEIGEAESRGGYALFDHALERMEAVTPADVQRVASTYLIPDHRTVGFYLPRDGSGGSWSSGTSGPDTDSGASGSDTDSGAPGSDTDSGALGSDTDSGAPGSDTDSGAPGSDTDSGAPGSDTASSVGAAGERHHRSSSPARSGAGRSTGNSDLEVSVTSAEMLPAREVLDNGAVLIVQESHENPTVVVHARLAGGLRLEPEGQAGVAALTAEAWPLGTRSRSASDLAELLESRGIALEFEPQRDALELRARCLSEDFPLLVDLIGEVLREPRFDAEQIEIAREAVLHGLREQAESTYSLAYHRGLAILYGDGSPYARLIQGDPAMVGSLRREELVAYHQRLLHAGGWSFAIVGDVTPLEARKLWADAIGSVPGGTPQLVPAPKLGEVPPWQVVPISVPDKSQVELVFVGAGVSPGTEGYEAAYLANAALGEAYTSRLNGTLRDDQGLTYGASSFFHRLVGGSLWTASLGVNPDNVDRALASVEQVLRTYRAEGLTQEEVIWTREYAAGSYALRTRSKDQIAAALLEAEMFGQGPETVSQFGDRLRATSDEEIQAAARRLVDPDHLVVVVAGTLEG